VTGPPRAEQACRDALRACLSGEGLQSQHLLVACSGGPDSVALALAAAFVVPRLGGTVGASVVDHRLQPGSETVAQQAAQTCSELGLSPVRVDVAEVAPGSTGPEDAARTARFAALRRGAAAQGAVAVLLGHTRDDQAEQVLLGLLRGSGGRSLSGMPPARAFGHTDHPRRPALRLLRPFLGVSRRATVQACQTAGLPTWADPHNRDAEFTRVRVREVLTDLEAGLGQDLRPALARTADLLRADGEALDQISDRAYDELGFPPWPVEAVLAHPAAVRTRLWRRMALEAGVPGSSLAAVHLRAVDALVSDWHGQGAVDMPGHRRVHREDGVIWLRDRRGG